MSEFLEAVMLLCFGASWPIAVVKNIKAGTAKSTSISFILLIIFGYLAGITAKLISHRINYVLIVYLFNLISVTANLVVYFINKRKDETKKKTQMEGFEMREMISEASAARRTQFGEMNTMAEKEGVVFFGGDYLAALPLSELSRSFHLNEAVYNRSVPGMKIGEAAEMADVCALELRPSKLFLNLGDADVQDANLDVEAFVADYAALLRMFRRENGGEIHMISIVSDTPAAKAVNARLRALAAEAGCGFIDAACAGDCPELRLFEQLRPFMRNHRISFVEAMTA